jgi:hypothetical protein
MFLQKVSKNMQFMKVIFQKACNLHMKHHLRDTVPATRAGILQKTATRREKTATQLRKNCNDNCN